MISLGACREALIPDVDPGSQSVGSMVLFASGMEGQATKAAVPFMEQEGRFVCRMFYHAKASDTDADPFDVKFPVDGGTMTTTWLRVNNAMGNSVYWNKEFPNPYNPELDANGFDKSAQAFYWQNRLEHAFLAVADYRYLKTATATAHDDIPALKMDYDVVREIESSENEYLMVALEYKYDESTYIPIPQAEWLPYKNQMRKPTESEINNANIESDGFYYFWTGDMEVNIGTEAEPVNVTVRARFKITGEKVKSKYYALKYDLSKDAKVPDMDMSKQPDPIQAFTIKKPAGATPEANRVNLYFKHQLSQVQVNLRTSQDGSANVAASDILSVELLGVTDEAYVYVVLNEDKTLRKSDFKEMDPTDGEDYGSAFLMFGRTLTQDDKDLGFIKSYEAIAFGRLEAIRIKWKENGDGEGSTEHTVVFKTNLELESGIRYIWNMELRRGTMPDVNPVIEDWQRDDTPHNADGTIEKNNS